MFELFPRKELEGIPTFLPLIEKIQKVEDVTTYGELQDSIKTFTNLDINFLHSPLLDGLYKGFTRHSPTENKMFDFHPAPSVDSMVKRLVNNDKYLPTVKWLVEKFSDIVDIDTLTQLTACFDSSSILKYLCDKQPIGENSAKKCFEKSLVNSVENGLEQNIHILLEKLITISCPGSSLGETFLLACEKGHLSVIDIFIKKGIIPDKNSLFIACKNKDISTLNLLLNHVNIEKVKDFLFIACCQYNIPEILIKVFDPLQNNKNRFGLMIACSQGNTEVVKFLLDQKVSATEVDLLKAISHNHLEIVKQLTTEITPNSVILACHREHVEILEYLLTFVNINFEDNYLIRTCYGREHLPKSVEFLINNGASLDGCNAVSSLACYKGDVKVVSALMKRGVKFTSDHLSLAIKSCSLPVCELLLRKNVPLNTEMVKYAITRKNKNLLEILKNYM